MPDPPAPTAADPAGCVLGSGTEFTGLVVLHGSARIEGCIRGQVLGAERLRIETTGRVEGQVEAAEVVVAGSLEGGLRARLRAELEATGRVRGVVQSPRLVVAEGAILEGPCRTGADLGSDGESVPASP
jgi:cytoskeletal protein CcmA (bactofilin family)